MKKSVYVAFLLLSVVSATGCETLFKKETKKTYKQDSQREDAEAPPKSSGYLSSGSTVRVDTGDGRSPSLIEQFEETRKSLAVAQTKIGSLEKELETERAAKKSLETEVGELKQQLETSRQIAAENEKLRKEIVAIQEPYEKKIKELSLELTKAQIEETKVRQELTSLKIDQLMSNKKRQVPQSTQDAQ